MVFCAKRTKNVKLHSVQHCMRVAIYARAGCGTLLDPDRGSVLDAQINRAQAFAAANGHQVVGTDTDIGGGYTRNPQFAALLDDALLRAFEAVIVIDLSRISRSRIHMERELSELARRHVKLIGTQGNDLIIDRQEFQKQIAAAMRREHGKKVSVGKANAKMKRAQSSEKGEPGIDRKR